MTDNLTERLREVRHVVSLPPDDGPTTADLCHQAAERIAKLEAELERTRQAWVNGDDPMCDDVCVIECKGPCGVTDE